MRYPLVLTNIAMGNDPFIDGLPNLKMGGCSMAMLNNQMVYFRNHIHMRYEIYFINIYKMCEI